MAIDPAGYALTAVLQGADFDDPAVLPDQRFEFAVFVAGVDRGGVVRAAAATEDRMQEDPGAQMQDISIGSSPDRVGSLA